MGTGINEIAWDEIEQDFIAGWKCWVGFGHVDTETCLRETSKGPVRVSFEFRDGYEAAAKDNDRGGEHPSDEHAADFAKDYLNEKQSAHERSYHSANEDDGAGL